MSPKDKMMGARVHTCRSPWRLDIVRWRIIYLWFLSIEFALCRPTGAYNFEVVPRFLENLCAFGLVKDKLGGL
jgi:hypothetical protein